MSLKTKKGRSKTNPERAENEPTIEFSTCALSSAFEPFDVAPVPARPGGKKVWEIARQHKKQCKRSEGVLENKGHHSFRYCTFRGFGAQLSPNPNPKRAKGAMFRENEVRGRDWHRDAGTVTSSRLDRLGNGLGPDLAQRRVAAPDRLIGGNGDRVVYRPEILYNIKHFQ